MTDEAFATWLPAHLSETYGIEALRVSRPQGHNPYVLRVDHDCGAPWIARAFGPERPRERTEGDAEILRLLEARGYPAERCVTDAPVSIAGDHTVLVTGFVDGRTPTTSKRSMRAFGSRLGELHSLAALSGAALREGGSWHGESEGLPASDLSAGLAMLDSVADRVAPHGVAARDRLREIVASADTCSDLPFALLHPDPGPPNAVDGPGGLTFVDWTGAGSGPRVVGLALLVQFADDLDGVAALCAGYREHVALSTEELDRMDDALAIRALFWACFYYRMSVQSGHTPSGGEGWWPNPDRRAAIAERVRAELG